MIHGSTLRAGVTALVIALVGACGGSDSGGTTPAADPPMPTTAPVLRPSSYENKVVAAEVTGSRALPKEVSSSNTLAYADFFQDRVHSLVTHTLVYMSSDPATSTQFGRFHFYKYQNGQWVDRTGEILGDAAGCLHPRKAVVADFNQDGRPDVFVACTGFDAPPYPGEAPRLLLSQLGGKYLNVALPFTGFIHGASAGDINGDGYPDVVVTSFGKPYFLINNQDGSFTADTTRLPGSVNGKPIFSAELIDFDGSGLLDLFLGGHESSGTWPATILKNDGHGNFALRQPLVLPAASGYGYPLDVVFAAGNIYLCRTIDAGNNFYGGAAIQRINYSTLASTIVYTRSGSQPFPNGRVWINWIAPHAGRIVSMDSQYGVSIAQ